MPYNSGVANIKGTPAIGQGTTAQRLVLIEGVLWLNLDTPASPYLEYYDGSTWYQITASAPTLPAWALAANALAGGEKFGSTNNFPINIYVNNVKVAEFFTTGNLGLNTAGVDSGDRLTVTGDIRTTNSLKVVQNSVTTVIGGNATSGNCKPLKIVSPGGAGGWFGGLEFFAGVNGTPQTSQIFTIGNFGGVGIGNVTCDSVRSRPMLLVKINTAPTATYSTGFLITQPQSYSQYSNANGYILPSLVMGGASSLNAPTASVMQIGWRWYPEAAGNASQMIVSGLDETTGIVDVLSVWTGRGGCVAIGTLTHNASAKLQVDSTTQGFLPPRMTTTQRDLITPTEGLEIYNLTTHKLQCYDGTIWQDCF